MEQEGQLLEAIEWLRAGKPLVDVRDEKSFHRAHLKGSSLMPAEILINKVSKLPPRATELGFFGSSQEDVDRLSAYVQEKGYYVGLTVVVNEDSFHSLLSDARPPSHTHSCCQKETRNEHHHRHAIEGSGEQKHEGNGEKHEDDNYEKRNNEIYAWLESGEDSKRMWRPSPLLDDAIDLAETAVLATRREGEEKVRGSHTEKDIESLHLTAIDVACGSGRDAVFLATRGWTVTAVDYLPNMIEKVAELAQENHVKDKMTLLCKDIEKDDSQGLKDFLNGFDLVNVARYLHRPALGILSEMVKPGGVLLYHTFMKGSESIGPCRPKNEKFLLLDGELRRFFAPSESDMATESVGDWEILVDKVVHISDGRPCSFFVAQRKR